MSLDNQGRVLAERRLSPTGNGGVEPSGLNAPWDARTIQTQFHHAGRCGSRTRTPYIQDIDNKCPGMSVRVFVLLWNQTPVLGQSRRNQSRMVTAHTASDLVNARDEHWSMRPHTPPWLTEPTTLERSCSSRASSLAPRRIRRQWPHLV